MHVSISKRMAIHFMASFRGAIGGKTGKTGKTAVYLDFAK